MPGQNFDSKEANYCPESQGREDIAKVSLANNIHIQKTFVFQLNLSAHMVSG